MNNKEQIVDDFMQILREPATRIELVRRSHYYFFYTYFSNYITYEVAPFQKKLFAITEDTSNKLAVVVSFRSSAKSTIMTMSYVLWSILGSQQKKFILIISQTQDQSRQHFKNLRRELEENKLLRNDLGPFKEDDWNSNTLVLTRYNARITAASSESAIRGLRHGEHRPDLIICDDVEDVNSIRTAESREKTYNWFNSEVMPLGDLNTRTIVVGNLLHEDCLIKRLEREITTGKRDGIYREYPIITEKGKILWPGKYPNMEAIKAQERSVDKFTWFREYMLRIIDNREPVVDPSWIQYYDQLPTILRDQGYSFATGVDLAISEKETADFTALVTAKVIGDGKNQKIYILPNPINDKLKFSEILGRAEGICKLHEGKSANKFYIEEVMLQGFMTQQLREKSIDAVGVAIRGKDKRTRLELAANPIFEGKVLFPRHGCEGLIDQALNFAVTKHDDLVDALTTLILGIIDKPPTNSPQLEFVRFNGYSRHTIDRGIGMGPGSTSSIEFTGAGVARRY